MFVSLSYIQSWLRGSLLDEWNVIGTPDIFLGDGLGLGHGELDELTELLSFSTSFAIGHAKTEIDNSKEKKNRMENRME